MQRCGFAAKGLFVMDGSRRSAHANAYFTGLGAAKRVVFFDTLLQRLSPGEVEAVLAHELGHFKHRHVLQAHGRDLRRSACRSGAAGLAGRPERLLRRPGRERPTWARRTTRWRCCCSCWRCRPSPSSLAPLMARRCRAGTNSRPTPMPARRPTAATWRSALLKLHEDNAATLTPDPLYVRFYYSHPPAAERLAACLPAAMTPPQHCSALPSARRRAWRAVALARRWTGAAAIEALRLRRLPPDDGLRERRGLDRAPRGPPSRSATCTTATASCAGTPIRPAASPSNDFICAALGRRAAARLKRRTRQRPGRGCPRPPPDRRIRRRRAPCCATCAARRPRPWSATTCAGR